MESTTTIAIIGVTAALVKILDMMVSTILKKAFPNNGTLTGEEKNRLVHNVDNLVEMHSVRNEDGAPIWYIPTSWADTQKEILHVVGDVSRTQERLAGSMERFVEILDRIDRRSEKN